LVKGQFPDYCVIGGNPARILKKSRNSDFSRVIK
jgi:acetyltransferase-like isoleucine patch superfamily enzyme